MNLTDPIHDYVVTDRRDDAEIYFASSNKLEAVQVANEIGYNFLVIRNSDGVIVHDAALHADLPLSA